MSDFVHAAHRLTSTCRQVLELMMVKKPVACARDWGTHAVSSFDSTMRTQKQLFISTCGWYRGINQLIVLTPSPSADWRVTAVILTAIEALDIIAHKE